jgi:Fur family ferric uptake transcriptional regulator
MLQMQPIVGVLASWNLLRYDADVSVKIDPHAIVLRQANLRSTPVRLAVLRVLANSRRPLDVSQIRAALPDSTDTVTVYRTLNTFAENKLVHRVRGEDRSWRYARGGATDTSDHRHPHFMCDECGKVECLTQASIPGDILESSAVGRGYKVEYPELVLHGRCPNCR